MNSQDADVSSKRSAQTNGNDNEKQALVPCTGMISSTPDTQDSGLGSMPQATLGTQVSELGSSSLVPATLRKQDSGSGSSISMLTPVFEGPTQIGGTAESHTQNELHGDVTNVSNNIQHYNYYGTVNQDYGKRKNDVPEDEASASKKSKEEESDVLQLLYNIKAFKNKKLHESKKIFEGEKTVLGRQIPLGIKLIDYSDAALREAEVLLEVHDHPNVVSIHDAGIHTEGKFDYVFLAMDLCSKKNLYDYVTTPETESFDLNLAISHAAQLICGMKYLHDKRVLHRDLKPHNILFAPHDEEVPNEQIKIADFGMSKRHEKDRFMTSQSHPGAGTRGYMAPEVLNGTEDGSEKVSPKTDVFSLGLTLHFRLSNGLHPYGSNHWYWDGNIADGDPTKWPNLSGLIIEDEDHKKEIEDLLKWMLQHKQEDRPTMLQVQQRWQSIMIRPSESVEECGRVQEEPNPKMCAEPIRDSPEAEVMAEEQVALVEPQEADEQGEEVEPKEAILLFEKNRDRVCNVLALRTTAEDGFELQEISTIPTSVSSQTYTTVLVGRRMYALSWMKYLFRLDLDNIVGGWRSEISTTDLHGKYPPAAALDDKIYVCGGGFDFGGTYRKTGESFPLESNLCEVFDTGALEGRTPWIKIADMNEARGHNSVVVLGGHLYSIGGWNAEKQPLNSVEKYSPATDTWELIKPMNEARYNAAATAYNGKIYVLGGENSASIEMHIPETGMWTLLPYELSAFASRCSAVVSNDKLFVVGNRKIEWVNVEENRCEVVSPIEPLVEDMATLALN